MGITWQYALLLCMQLLSVSTMRDAHLVWLVVLSMPAAMGLDAAWGAVGAAWAGAAAWAVLIALLSRSSATVRRQACVAVAVAVCGEMLASLLLHAYTYTRGAIPWYVPPGHGILFLGLCALSRAPVWTRWVVRCVGVGVAAWACFSAAFRGDAVSGFLLVAFGAFVTFGRAPPQLYLSAFFATTYLEELGTRLGCWRWAHMDPVLGLSQANPPALVVGFYCIFIEAALAVA